MRCPRELTEPEQQIEADPSATKHWLGVAGSETHVPSTGDADVPGVVGPGVGAAVVGAAVVGAEVVGEAVVGEGVVGAGVEAGVVGGEGPPQAGVVSGGGERHCESIKKSYQSESWAVTLKISSPRNGP
jgi:hypothetical protein